MSNQINIERIRIVREAMGDIAEKIVFVGGATVALYADRPTFDPRPTDDVDVVVEVYHRRDYIHLEEQLRQKGYGPDPTARFIGRYIINGVIVDVMPTILEILGFDNKWYSEGFANSIEKQLDENTSIHLFSTPHFIASKLEAFKARGRNNDGNLDGRGSQDFEDIIFIFENRSSIWSEIQNAAPSVRSYLFREISELLSNPFINEWVEANVSYGLPPADVYIINNMKELVSDSRSLSK